MGARRLAALSLLVAAVLLGQGVATAGAAPLNDDLAAAESLGSGDEASSSGNNGDATKEPLEPDHAGNAGGHSVWFSWTAPKDMGVTISVCSGELDTLLGVYTGSSYPLVEVAASDDNADNCELRSAVTFSASGGMTYRVAVDGKDGAVGDFNLKVAQTPANDDLAHAETLGNLENPLPWWHEGNQFATTEAGEPDHAGEAGGHSVWFEWTAPSSGRFSFDTGAYYQGSCSSSFDTLLAVYTGSLFPLTEVSSDDDGSPCGGGASRVVIEATAGATYEIAVDGKNGATGNLELQIRPQPANDSLASARSLPSASHVFSYGQNQLATKEVGEPNHAGNAGGRSVWFSWVAPSSSHVVVNTCESTVDTLLAVYSGDSYPLTGIASNDDGGSCGGGRSQVEFDASAGTTYRIAVDGKDGAEGAYGLEVRTSPRNDRLAGASPLPFPLVGDSAFNFYSNTLATKEPGEPNHAGSVGGHSVWVSWTPTVSARVRIATDQDGSSGCRSDGIDTLLAVYSGDSYPLTEIASNDDGGGCPGGGSQLEFDAVAGTSYKIAIDGKNGAEGTVPLLVLRRPAYDALAGAADVKFAAPATNVLATKEPGEPNHAGDAGGHSLWYSLSTPTPKKYRVATCTSDFDTLLAVYTGGGFPLTPVASNDDACGQQSSILLAARPGTTYLIALDGKGGATGRGQAELTLSGEDLDTAIDSGPTGPVPSGQVSFAFHSNFADTDFLCRFDSDAFTPCVGSFAPTAPLAPGPHAFEVKSSISGLEADSTPATTAFIVSGQPAEVPPPKGKDPLGAAADTEPPDSFFARKPKAVLLTGTKTRRVLFAFESSEPGSTFLCKLDRGGYDPCSSPARLSVGLGLHEFRVMAVDAAGNRDASPARRSFRVRRR